MNKLNSGKLEDLQVGQTLLTQVRGISGGKISLEIAEMIQKSGTSNLLGMLNASDDRFKSISARRGWISAEIVDAEKLLGVKIGEVSFGDTKELNILNPNIANQLLRLRIVESTIPQDDWQADKDNFSRAAKHYVDEDGNKIFLQVPSEETGELQFIYSKTFVEGFSDDNTPEHNFITHTDTISEEELELDTAIASTPAEVDSVE